MSTFEYNDMFLLCQDTGKYHMFVFDMIDSSKMSSSRRLEAQLQMIKLMTRMYNY